MIIDFTFVVDIGLMFFSSIMTKQGTESFYSDEIAHAYVSTTRFWLDILSVLGADVFKPIHPYMALFGMFKITRVLRIGEMIGQSTAEEAQKATLNLLKLILYLFLYLHIIACYWYIAINYNTGQIFYR